MSEIPKRKYGLTDSELSQITINGIAFLTRDVGDLAKYGVTLARIGELSALQQQFEVFPIDRVKIAQIKQAVAVKDAKRVEVEDAAADIRIRAENVFKENPGLYEEFAFDGYSSGNDFEFGTQMHMIALAAAKYQTELAEYGQTAAETTAFTALVNEYQDRLQQVSFAKGDRTEAARARINLGNELYELLVELSGFGRACYVKKNPAKYSEYIIYTETNVPKTPPDAPEIEVVDGYAELVFTEDVTSVEMFKRSSPSDPWEKILDGENAPALVGTISGTLYLQGRGRNDAGWGPMASKTIIGTMGSPSNVRFEDDRTLWDNAPGTEYSELQVSYDNGVTFQEVGVIVGAGVYVWTPPSGTVILRVRNCAGEVKGPWVVITVVIP